MAPVKQIKLKRSGEIREDNTTYDQQCRRKYRVTLLGTGTPGPLMNRFGPSTLVDAGGDKFMFDAGRGAMQRLFQLGIRSVDNIFSLIFTPIT